jgi:Uncharacterised nucleotidyltransferase
MRLVLALALRLHFQPEAAGAFREAMAGCGVTERLLAFADTCYALPMLASAVKKSALGARRSALGGGERSLSLPSAEPGVDRSTRAPSAILDNAYYACAARRVALLALIERVADVLVEGQIPFLLLKGAALEVLAPRAPAVRVTADLDVLVPRGTMAHVERLLGEAGFQPRYAGHAETFRRHSHHAVPYEAGRGLGAVEVHETLAPRGAPVRLPTEPFWRRSRPVIWRQREIHLPAAEELVLHTCAHYGLLHPYNTTLRRLWDLALILGEGFEVGTPGASARAPEPRPGFAVCPPEAGAREGLSREQGATAPPRPAIDWEYVTGTARRWGARKVLDQALSELAWLVEGQRSGRSVDPRLGSGRSAGPRQVLPQPSAERRAPSAAAKPPEEWPLFEAPYSALAAFCLEQRATDNAWGRLRGLWRFLLPGPHETAPLRAERAHWRYLLDRFAHGSPGRRGRTGQTDGPESGRPLGEEQGSDDD